MTKKRRIKPLLPDQKYCTPDQAARLMGVSRYLIDRWLHEDRIPGFRTMGRRILIPVAWCTGSVDDSVADG